MENAPDTVKCPYCGAANGLENEFCGTCRKELMIPAGVRAELKAARILAEAGAAGGVEARLWWRVAVITALFLFYTRWLQKDNYFSPLDLVNLGFHEAGHIFLGFFGRFIMMSGGTIFQLLIPGICLAHLKLRGANLGWQLCLFWIGENLLNISIYAGDAVRQALPLVGGGEHDWAYLLTEMHLIAHTDGVSMFIFLCGSAVIFWSFYLIGRDAVKREPIKLGSFGRLL
jgi:hypothetical protein